MDKPTIWFFGCSMTYGFRCHPGDDYFIKHRQDGDEIWTKIVSNSLGHIENNKGKIGASNIEILRIILDNKDNIKSDDIVIVGLSDGTRVQTFYKENSISIPMTFHNWTIEEFPCNDKGLDKDFINSMTGYMVNCRLLFTDDHINYDLKLIEDVLSLIKPKSYLIWKPELWEMFETICTDTSGKIVDHHWSFNGHKQMAEWILSNNKKLT